MNIFKRNNTDQKQLKIDCVDIVSKCYLELGQKPDTQQVVLMAQLLYNELIRFHKGLTTEEVQFAFEKGIRDSDNGGFVNVRNFNIWLKEFKTKAALRRQQRRLTDFELDRQNQKFIANTINQAKFLK
jgi:hypothetical protein|tara:strand:+ start:9417 stop:9800 length:384 start_codon:yes stop_codon:yes gene_type:complete